MKKIALAIVVIASLLTPSFTKAVSYRGFVEGSVGFCSTDKFDYDLPPTIIDGSTTHGVQVSKNFFVGLGAMYRYSTVLGYDFTDNMDFFTDYNHYIRPYLCIRWDGFGLFKKSSRVSPFVDLKFGYNFRISPNNCNFGLDGDYQEDGYDYSYSYYQYGGYGYDNDWEEVERKIEYDLNGWFFRPTIGVRIGCSSKVGINIGLFCDISRLIKVKEANFVVTGLARDYGSYERHERDIPIHIKSQSVMWFPVGVTLGVDF